MVGGSIPTLCDSLVIVADLLGSTGLLSASDATVKNGLTSAGGNLRSVSWSKCSSIVESVETGVDVSVA